MISCRGPGDCFLSKVRVCTLAGFRVWVLLQLFCGLPLLNQDTEVLAGLRFCLALYAFEITLLYSVWLVGNKFLFAAVKKNRSCLFAAVKKTRSCLVYLFYKVCLHRVL